jgi:hypothetical protein
MMTAKNLLVAFAAAGLVACAKAPPARPRASGPPADEPPSPSPSLRPALEARAYAGPKGPLAVRFAWSLPCRVPIVETDEEGNQMSRHRAELVVERRGGEVLVRRENVRIELVRGLDASSPGARQAVAFATALAGLAPPFAVSEGGRFAGVRDDGAAVERALAAVAALGWKLDERAADGLRSPLLRAAAARHLEETWDGWVGAWVGRPVVAGASATYPNPVALADGSSVEVPLVVTHHGDVAGAPGLALVSIAAVTEGEAMRRMAAVTSADVATQWAEAADSLAQITRRETRYTVALDPRRAMPFRARRDETLEAAGRVRRKATDTTFLWDEAKGCFGR